MLSFARASLSQNRDCPCCHQLMVVVLVNRGTLETHFKAKSTRSDKTGSCMEDVRPQADSVNVVTNSSWWKTHGSQEKFFLPHPITDKKFAY